MWPPHRRRGGGQIRTRTFPPLPDHCVYTYTYIYIICIFYWYNKYLFRFIFFTYFHSVRVVFCVTYYYRLSYYTYIYKILYVRSSVIRPRSRLTFRKIKTRIVGCKTPRRCQEITAICRRFVVAVHKHTSSTTPPSS